MQPIGVFDSGMGGLTVLRALREALPGQSFVYLGDTARLPYGSKSPDTVCRYATQAARILVQHNVQMIVVACNTASSIALETLKQAFAPVPVLGVVEPGADAVAHCVAAQSQVLVLATESTVAGAAYPRAILRRVAQVSIHSRAAPLLVALAEEGRTEDALVELALRDYLKGFLGPRAPDCLLLGCTHFPVFRGVLERLLPKTRILDSATTTARAVRAHVGDSESLRLAQQQQGSVRFLATDGLARFERVGPVFFGAKVEQAELVDL